MEFEINCIQGTWRNHDKPSETYIVEGRTVTRINEQGRNVFRDWLFVGRDSVVKWGPSGKFIVDRERSSSSDLFWIPRSGPGNGWHWCLESQDEESEALEDQTPQAERSEVTQPADEPEAVPWPALAPEAAPQSKPQEESVSSKPRPATGLLQEDHTTATAEKVPPVAFSKAAQAQLLTPPVPTAKAPTKERTSMWDVGAPAGDRKATADPASLMAKAIALTNLKPPANLMAYVQPSPAMFVSAPPSSAAAKPVEPKAPKVPAPPTAAQPAQSQAPEVTKPIFQDGSTVNETIALLVGDVKGVNGVIEVLKKKYGCSKGQRLRVVGQHGQIWQCEGGKTISKLHEGADWRWVLTDAAMSSEPATGLLSNVIPEKEAEKEVIQEKGRSRSRRGSKPRGDIPKKQSSLEKDRKRVWRDIRERSRSRDPRHRGSSIGRDLRGRGGSRGRDLRGRGSSRGRDHRYRNRSRSPDRLRGRDHSRRRDLSRAEGRNQEGSNGNRPRPSRYRNEGVEGTSANPSSGAPPEKEGGGNRKADILSRLLQAAKDPTYDRKGEGRKARLGKEEESQIEREARLEAANEANRVKRALKVASCFPEQKEAQSESRSRSASFGESEYSDSSAMGACLNLLPDKPRYSDSGEHPGDQQGATAAGGEGDWMSQWQAEGKNRAQTNTDLLDGLSPPSPGHQRTPSRTPSPSPDTKRRQAEDADLMARLQNLLGRSR